MLPGLPIPMEHVSAHPMTSQSIRLVRFDGSHLTGTYFTVDCERISRRSVDLTKRKMRRLGSASFVALLAACGGQSVTSPSTSRLNLFPGLHWLTVTGFNISVDPAFPPCTPATIPPTPPSGTVVTTPVSLEREGDEWVARSSAGSLQLRLREGDVSAGLISVTGSLQGTVDDADHPPVHVASGSILSASGAAPGSPADVTGTGTPASPNAPTAASFVGGRAAGLMTFRDAENRMGSCAVVQWSLLPN
jgi:hypothetical protein